MLTLFRTTCGNAWLPYFRPLLSVAAVIPGDCAFRTVLPLRASCTCFGLASPGVTFPPRPWVAPGDGLASAAGLDRSRRLASPARRLAERTAPCGSSGPGRLRRGRVTHQGPQRGDHVGPSPVDRARPGSKHHLIVDRHGTPLAATLTGGNCHDVTQLLPRTHRYGGVGVGLATSLGVCTPTGATTSTNTAACYGHAASGL